MSFIMAILWSDHVSDLSAEEAIKQVRYLNLVNMKTKVLNREQL